MEQEPRIVEFIEYDGREVTVASHSDAMEVLDDLGQIAYEDYPKLPVLRLFFEQ